MDFCDFINKYTGAKVDYDGRFGPQCVDLFRQYTKDVCGFVPTKEYPNTGSVEGAKDLWHNYRKFPKEQEFYIQTIGNYKCGDLIIWDKSATNEYGHVALVVSALDGNRILVFEQDGFKKDGAKFTVRSLNNVLGALRPKNS